MGKEYTDGGGAPIDYSRDGIQGCTHQVYGGMGSVTSPRSIEPRKTWLDECAFAAMIGIISNIDRFDLSEYNGRTRDKLSCLSYDVASAMLAEKMKREAKE